MLATALSRGSSQSEVPECAVRQFRCDGGMLHLNHCESQGMETEKWPGAVNEALAALIADGEARRTQQLQALFDCTERGHDTAEALNDLRLTEESLAALRSQQGYRRARGRPMTQR